MSLFFSNKVVRLLLSISVSIWMAGGCLFGCSNTTMAAETADNSAQTIEAGESCHAARSAHDCCASQKPKKQTTTRKVNAAGRRDVFRSHSARYDERLSAGNECDGCDFEKQHKRTGSRTYFSGGIAAA